MRYVDAIFFDLDGTLVDSREDIVNAVNYGLEVTGAYRKSYEEIISYVGSGVKDLIMKSLGSGNLHLVDSCLEKTIGYFREHCTDESRLYPNVKDILEFYKEKKLMIVTNRMTDLTKKTLKDLGIDMYFRKVIGGDDESCLKPSACPLIKALDGYVRQDETSIMVGDMDIDVRAGKNAGIYTCAVTYGIGNREDIESSGPDYIIDDMMQLKDHIK